MYNLLFSNGDFTTRSNDVETICRRVNPDDWDDDGLANEIDPNPLVCDGDFFGPANILPEGANTNAYCTVSLSATGPDTLVVFEGDGPSDYPDPRFVARHGETNEVLILIGKTYTVSSAWPIEFTGASDSATEIFAPLMRLRSSRPLHGETPQTHTVLAKLERISGPDLPLAPVIVPPETQVAYSIVYECAEASDAADDVAVAASVVGNDSSGMASDSDSMTSVRLELAAVWEAPENPCTNRHVYGVGERVRIRTFPESVPTSVSLTRIHDSESSLYDNMIDNVEKIYACPVYAAPPNLKVVCHDAEYRPAMTVCEPNTIICKGAAWDTSCLSPGTVNVPQSKLPRLT